MCQHHAVLMTTALSFSLKPGGMLSLALFFLSHDCSGRTALVGVDKNPPALIPGLGRFHVSWSNYTHVLQLLSLSSRAQEPELLSPSAKSPCSTTRKATTIGSLHTATESSPHSLQLEKACVWQRRSKAAKSK